MELMIILCLFIKQIEKKYKDDKFLLEKEITEFMKILKKESPETKNLFDSFMLMKLIEKIHKNKVSLARIMKIYAFIFARGGSKGIKDKT